MSGFKKFLLGAAGGAAQGLGQQAQDQDRLFRQLEMLGVQQQLKEADPDTALNRRLKEAQIAATGRSNRGGGLGTLPLELKIQKLAFEIQKLHADGRFKEEQTKEKELENAMLEKAMQNNSGGGFLDTLGSAAANLFSGGGSSGGVVESPADSPLPFEQQNVRVKLSDGRTGFVDVSDFDPNTMTKL